MIRLPAALRRTTPFEFAARELADSELQRLAHQNAIDYSTALLSYHDARIARLRDLLASSPADTPDVARSRPTMPITHS